MEIVCPIYIKFEKICVELGIIGVAFASPALHGLFKNFGYPRLYKKKIGKFFPQVKTPVVDTFSAFSKAFENDSISALVASTIRTPVQVLIKLSSMNFIDFF